MLQTLFLDFPSPSIFSGSSFLDSDPGAPSGQSGRAWGSAAWMKVEMPMRRERKARLHMVVSLTRRFHVATESVCIQTGILNLRYLSRGPRISAARRFFSSLRQGAD
jgi:hypothetical protein